MLRLKDTRHAHTGAFLASAVKLAEYYGFEPLENVLARTQKKASTHHGAVQKNDITFTHRDEKSLLSMAKKTAFCINENQPTALVWHVEYTKERPISANLELHIIGAPTAVAEALLLTVASTIADEAGVTERAVSINSMGSHESSNRFVRDVGIFLRKHIESITPSLRPRAALDPIGTLIQLIERRHPAIARLPQSVEYLTEDERERFWELLEYLETLHLPYELNAQVLGSRDCWSHTLFEINTKDPDTKSNIVFARGGRYDPLITRLRGVPTPAVRIYISCETRGRIRLKSKKRARPAVYFAHLGGQAKRKVFAVLETLRHAKIPVHQSLLMERMGEQMMHAKRLGVPCVLIMGHKEALEGSVLVREVATNSQDSVPVDRLIPYLRRHRIHTWKPTRVKA